MQYKYWDRKSGLSLRALKGQNIITRGNFRCVVLVSFNFRPIENLNKSIEDTAKCK